MARDLGDDRSRDEREEGVELHGDAAVRDIFAKAFIGLQLPQYRRSKSMRFSSSWPVS